ncbi:MAG: DUF1573 domain-containing protein [Bacteroidetes bacterium]|jgi:hypothetical protein|nr:DUF1573 domain-containing protein [Bacteroidota bacterium]
MKNLFLALIAVTMLMVSCNSNGNNVVDNGSASSATADKPVMKFEKETHDFGKIVTGSKVSYEFKFTNTGKSPLIIKDAIASCGCTKPEWPSAPVKPGEDGVIKVTFDSRGKMGLQDKMITITANTNPAQNLVHLIGEVTAN